MSFESDTAFEIKKNKARKTHRIIALQGGKLGPMPKRSVCEPFGSTLPLRFWELYCMLFGISLGAIIPQRDDF